MGRNINGTGPEGLASHQRSTLRAMIRLMHPGLRFKRWLLVGAVGVFAGAVAVAYVARRFLSIPFPNFLPFNYEWVFFLCLGLVLVAASVYGLYRSLGPFLLASSSVSNGFAQTLYSRRQQEKGPKVVAIGGGTGLSTLLRGIKEHTSNLTAIVTVADDGGSSGRLRRELGILPPGDFRNCLVAMADAESLVTRLFQYRFGEGSGLEGHSFGNLFIVAMSGVTGGFESAIYESSRVLAVRGRILPATLANLSLSARMEDETVIHGESNITQRGGKIKQLSLVPENPEAYPAAVEAILEAQLIIIGPGSLYTSILPNLLVPGIGKAVESAQALKVYVCNVATQKGETDGYSVSDHVDALRRHTGSTLVDYVLANNNMATLGPEFSGSPVRVTGWAMDTPKLVQADLVNPDFLLHHDPHKLASNVMDLYYNNKRLSLGKVSVNMKPR